MLIVLNVFPYKSHLKSFIVIPYFWWCTATRCFLRLCLSLKGAPQTLHFTSSDFECTLLKWWLRTYFVEKHNWHMLHWKSFVSSCIICMWRAKLLLTIALSQNEHSAMFSVQWTFLLWTFTYSMVENDFLQMLQSMSFILSCTDLMCFFNFGILKNSLSHLWHLCGLSFLCTAWSWALNSFGEKKHFPHELHFWFFNFWWTASIWSLRPEFDSNLKSHWSQLWFLIL